MSEGPIHIEIARKDSSSLIWQAIYQPYQTIKISVSVSEGVARLYITGCPDVIVIPEDHQVDCKIF